MVREATVMSDDLERLLESLTPRSAPAELRGRVLRIVEEELRPVDGLPASIEPALSPSELGQALETSRKGSGRKRSEESLLPRQFWSH